MSEDVTLLHKPAAGISAEALQRAEEMIEKEEGVHNKLVGTMAAFVTAVAVVMSLFHLYTAYAIVRPEHLRATHVAFVLFLSFLVFPVARRFRDRVMWWDWLLALGGVATSTASQPERRFCTPSSRSIISSARASASWLTSAAGWWS